MDYYDEPQEPSDLQKLEYFLRQVNHAQAQQIQQLSSQLTSVGQDLLTCKQDEKKLSTIFFIVMLVSIFLCILLFLCTFSKMCCVLKQGVNMHILPHIT